MKDLTQNMQANSVFAPQNGFLCCFPWNMECGRFAPEHETFGKFHFCAPKLNFVLFSPECGMQKICPRTWNVEQILCLCSKQNFVFFTAVWNVENFPRKHGTLSKFHSCSPKWNFVLFSLECGKWKMISRNVECEKQTTNLPQNVECKWNSVFALEMEFCIPPNMDHGSMIMAKPQRCRFHDRQTATEVQGP